MMSEKHSEKNGPLEHELSELTSDFRPEAMMPEMGGMVKSMKAMAEMAVIYQNELLQRGFSDDATLQLVKDWHSIWWSSVCPKP